MKKTVLSLTLCLCAFVPLSLFSEQWTMTITNSTRCIPSQSIATNLITARTNGIVVAQGGYYSSGGRTYMAITAGTSTNAPVHRIGVATGADGVSWLTCLPTIGGHGIVACVMTGTEVNYNLGASATTNCPWMVKNIFYPARGDWQFIPASGSTTISFLAL